MIKLLPLLIKISSQIEVLDDAGSGGSAATAVSPETTSAVNFCTNFTPVWTILGYILFAIKVIVPILLIVTSMITFVKAIINSNEKDTTAAFNLIKMKVIYAIAIFVIIQAVSILVGLVSKNSLYKQCATCTFKPFEDSCYIIKPATDPDVVDYIDPVKPNQGNSGNVSSLDFFTNGTYWKEDNYTKNIISIPSTEKCVQNRTCVESFSEDGIVRVSNGVFYLPKNNSLNGQEVARGSAKEGLNQTFYERLEAFFAAASKAGYDISVKENLDDGFRSIDAQNYYCCCASTSNCSSYEGPIPAYVTTNGRTRTCTGRGTCNGNGTIKASTPGTSPHGWGLAADLNLYLKGGTTKNKQAIIWAHENAERFGLAFPVSNEDWHIEPLYICNINGSCSSSSSRRPNYVCQESKSKSEFAKNSVGSGSSYCNPS